MKTNKLQEYLHLIKFKENLEWDDLFGFEKNWKASYKKKEVEARLKYLDEWEGNIGQEIYKNRKGFNYILVADYTKEHGGYFDNSFSTVFTPELFEILCKDYFQYQVKRLTEDLTENTITSNSTSKLRNLAFEWELECKQELLKLFKEL